MFFTFFFFFFSVVAIMFSWERQPSAPDHGGRQDQEGTRRDRMMPHWEEASSSPIRATNSSWERGGWEHTSPRPLCLSLCSDEEDGASSTGHCPLQPAPRVPWATGSPLKLHPRARVGEEPGGAESPGLGPWGAARFVSTSLRGEKVDGERGRQLKSIRTWALLLGWVPHNVPTPSTDVPQPVSVS